MSKYVFVILVLAGIQCRAQVLEEKFHSWESACEAVKGTVAEGDLIFLDIPEFLFRKVAEGSRSWASHVGVAFKDENGGWIVADSTIPLSREVPLCEFLRDSSEYKFEVRRLNRPLSYAEVGHMRVSAKSMLQKPYTLGFDFDSNWFFCSKFAYLVYQSIGVEVGRLQTFRELLEENPDAAVTFWRIWFLGFVPWDRRTVTPASELRDSKFISVLKGA